VYEMLHANRTTIDLNVSPLDTSLLHATHQCSWYIHLRSRLWDEPHEPQRLRAPVLLCACGAHRGEFVERALDLRKVGLQQHLQLLHVLALAALARALAAAAAAAHAAAAPAAAPAAAAAAAAPPPQAARTVAAHVPQQRGDLDPTDGSGTGGTECSAE
jgi:hypothetical protein